MRSNRVGRAFSALALVLGQRAGHAGNAEWKPKPGSPGVIVYVSQDNLTVAELGLAEQTVSRIFARIGVPVIFHGGVQRKSPGDGSFAIELQLDAKAPAKVHPGIMAYALPFANRGTRIHVFYDRVRNASQEGGAGTILGHVMAHEMVHVLEGFDRHSAEGVMKALWETSDYLRMKSGTLPFDPADAALVHEALKKRSAETARNAHPPR